MSKLGNDYDIRQIAVVEDADEDTLVVALGEQQDGTGRALLFQLSGTFDEQDVALGMDTYCLSDESGATVYGGVTSCVLDGNLLTLHFTAEAAATLALDNHCRFALLVNPTDISQLRDGLRRIFAVGPTISTLQL